MSHEYEVTFIHGDYGYKTTMSSIPRKGDFVELYSLDIPGPTGVLQVSKVLWSLNKNRGNRVTVFLEPVKIQ